MFDESTPYSFEAAVGSPEATIEPSLEVRPKSSKELADEWGVSDKTIQIWFRAICSAYPWIAPEALKTGRSAKTRYTFLCQELIAEYRTAAVTQSEEDWIASVHAAHAEKFQSPDPAPVSTVDPAPSAGGMVPFQISVRGIEGVSQQQQQHSQALTLRDQATSALSTANQDRLTKLREFFAAQQQQRQADQTQRREELRAEAQNEAIEEFLIKQEEKTAILSQLEQLNSLGKLTAPAASPAG